MLIYAILTPYMKRQYAVNYHILETILGETFLMQLGKAAYEIGGINIQNFARKQKEFKPLRRY